MGREVRRKVLMSFRCSKVIADALKELLREDRGKLGLLRSQDKCADRKTATDWIEHAIRFYLYSILLGADDVDTKFLRRLSSSPNDVARFFVNYANAKRDVDGYVIERGVPFGPEGIDYPEMPNVGQEVEGVDEESDDERPLYRKER